MLITLISILSILTSIILMAMPSGIAMTFASGPHERITSYYSYFDLMPLGYGNWLPIITVILSFIALLLLLVGLKKPNKGKAVQVCVIICIMSTLFSWIIFNTFTITGVFVASLHLIVFILQKHLNKR